MHGKEHLCRLTEKVAELKEDMTSVRERLDRGIEKMHQQLEIIQNAALQWGYAATSLSELETVVQELREELQDAAGNGVRNVCSRRKDLDLAKLRAAVQELHRQLETDGSAKSRNSQ